MPERATRVLLLEDAPADAEVVKAALAQRAGEFETTHVETLSEAVRALGGGAFDVIVTDLNVPDSKGLDTFLALHRRFPTRPIVVSTGMGDEMLAIRALRHGAQDYIVKGADGRRLLGSVRFAIERQNLYNDALEDLTKREKIEAAMRKCGTAHLWQAMFRVMGQGGASVILYQAGEAAGGTTFDFVEATYGAGDDAAFRKALAEHMGLAGLLIVRDFELDRKNETLYAEVQRGFESAIPTRVESPTCHFTRGFFAGIANRLLDTADLTGDETACEAQGAETCTFIVRKLGGARSVGKRR